MRNRRSRLARPLRFVATIVAALFAAEGTSAQELTWVHRFGGEFFDLGLAVAADESGAYVAGAAISAIPGETAFGAQDAFIRKVDPSGSPIWTDQFGTSDFDRIEGLAVDATGVYAAGWTGATLPGQQSNGLYDAFVRKYDANGTVLWTMQFGAAGYDEALGIAAAGSAVYVVGFTQGGMADGGGGGASDIFVRKMDRDGAVLWTTELGGAGPDNGQEIAVHEGSVYVVGCTDWDCGSFNEANAYVARLSSDDGSVVWERGFGELFVQDEALAVAADTSGIYVAGWTQGTLPGQTSAGFLDGYVRKYTAEGTEAWTRQFGSSSDDRAHGIAVQAGIVYTVGVTGGALPGEVWAGFDDVFVAAFDGESGSDQWTLQFGSGDFETGRAVTALPGRLYVAGDGVVFGPVVFPTTLPDAFVARIGFGGIDSTPPVLTVPVQLAADALDPAGVVVSFTATAADAVDGEVPVVCSPASGSLFPIGTTTVTCSATDAAGNTASASFVVLVNGAAEQLAELEAAVAGIGTGTSLSDKVADARTALAGGAAAQACQILAAFTHQVIAQSTKSISEALAAELLSTAARIRAVLAC